MVPRVMAFSFYILATASTYADTGAAREQQVIFQGASGARLAGTLLVPSPDRGGRCPAMVILAGSGPTDRNGNQPPALTTDLLKQLAEGLAEEGIVSLRFDKRGMYANAAELPKDKAQYGDFFSWENFVGDAAAAHRFLRQQPQVDPNRVGILGHSEGGLLALAASLVLKQEGCPPGVLILISTPGRKIDAVIAEQLENLLGRQGATPQQTDYFRHENARVARAILQTGKVPADVPPGLAALYPQYLGKFLKSELALDPCKLAAQFSGPVMVMAGSADTQVSSQRDAKALAMALSSRRGDDHNLLIIPKASHNLKIIEKAGEPGFSGEIAPQAMREIKSWTLSKLMSAATNQAP